MDLQSESASATPNGTAAGVRTNTQSNAAEGGKKERAAKKRTQRRVRPAELVAPQYQIRTTVVRKKVKVGDQGLARLLEKQWLGIHYALYYVTVFAPTAIGGRTVNAANVGIREYIQERLEAADRMLGEAQALANESGIEMGAPGQTSEHVVEISSQIETDVLAMVRAYDDYLVVMDSLWIGKEVLDDKRDAAHRIVREDISAMSKLMAKLRSKLITYRREKGAGTLTKTDEAIVLEVEDIIIESLSTQAQEQKLKERERQETKAKKREEKAAKGTGSKAEARAGDVAPKGKAASTAQTPATQEVVAAA